MPQPHALRGPAVVCIGLLLSFLPFRPLTAQSTAYGGLGGTIALKGQSATQSASQDANQTANQGFEIVATNHANNVTHRATSDADGNWRMEHMEPGVYTVEIVAPALLRYRAEDVVVEVGRVTRISPRLKLTGASDSVVVTATAPRLDTTSPAVTTNIDALSLSGLPSNGRRWSNFALLTPGVVADQAGFGLLSFRGISVLLNNNTVDGADNNQAFFSEERGRTRIGYSTSQDAVQEFQVNTSNYSAEYGRAAGGVVNTVTKSGSNGLHGHLFFFDRDNAWGTYNRYTTLTQRDATGAFQTFLYKPKDWRKQWGASLGGPVRRNRLFWFFTYDQYQRNFPGVARAGNATKFFATPSAQTITTLAGRMGSTSTAALEAYQHALDGLASELGQVPRTASQTIFFPKLDWQPSARTHLSVQYNHMSWSSPGGVQTQSSNPYGVASFGNDYAQEDWAIARWNLFLTPNVVNEARYQYGRDFESEFTQTPTPFEQAFSHNTYGRPPEIKIDSSSSGFTIGKPSFLDRPAYPDERRNQFIDDITFVRGNHVGKLGYDYNHVLDVSDNLRNGNGTYSYTSVLNFVSDLVAPNRCDTGGSGVAGVPCYSYYSQSLGPEAFAFSSNDIAFFYSDEWKLRPSLTLSLGVRWEYERLPNTSRNLINPDIPQTRSLPHDGNNFGPRVGLAWDIGGNGHTVVRAGYGIYYGRIVNSTAFSALTNTGSPNGQRGYDFRPLDVGAPPFPYVFSSDPVNEVKPSAVYFDPHFQNPQIHQAELSIGQEIGSATELSVSFLESLGRELPNFIDTNVDLSKVGTITYRVSDTTGKGPLPATYTTKFFTTRLNPNYQQITDIFSETNSRYQAAVVKLTHRTGRLLHLRATYTYAHAQDFNQNESTFTDANDIYDPTNFKGEYGVSNFDVRQRVTGDAMLQTPWRVHGWWGALVNGYSVAPVVQLQTGLPFTLRTSGAVPSVKYLDSVNRTETLSGLGYSVNGFGGDNRIPEVGRNTYRYPGTVSVDARASKETRVSERTRLEVMAEVFNVLNHQNVTGIDTNGYFISGASSATSEPRLTYDTLFGQVRNSNSTTLYRERQVQVAVRLNF